MTTLNRRIRLLPSTVLVTAATICCSQVSAGPQRTSQSQTVSGQVVNSITGEPIARARVQVGAQLAALTDHDGHFAFDDVSEEPAYAFASKPGYFAEDNAVPARGQSIALKLIPEAILFGTITDQNGQPIQDLPIQLTTLRVENGLRRWRPMQGTTTNVEGQFRFAELQAGQYSLATGFRIEGLVGAPSSIAFLPVTFPPLTGDGIRGALTLMPGDHVEANASPAMEKLYPVTGVINGNAGQGANLIAVRAKDGEPVDSPANYYPGGEFRLRLPTGSYRLSVHSAVEHEQQLVGTREISVSAAPLQGMTVTLAPPVILPIEVEYQAVTAASQTASGGPPPYLNASLQEEDPQGPGYSSPAQPLKPPGRGQAREPGDPMVFRDIEPGRYILEALPQPPWYVASASCGNLDLTRDPLVIGAGAGACTVRMVYRDDSASLKWLASPAKDGDGSEVFVIAIPLDTLTQPAMSSTIIPDHPLSTDSPAEGSFDGLAPGRYVVVALPHRQDLPYRDHEALQRYTSLGQEITLTRGGKSEVQLTIVTGEP
jgi:hypothetical protein